MIYEAVGQSKHNPLTRGRAEDEVQASHSPTDQQWAEPDRIHNHPDPTI